MSNTVSQVTQCVMRVDVGKTHANHYYHCKQKQAEQRLATQWSGYGFRVNDSGFLITCKHLVSDVSTITVTDVRGNVRAASVVCSSSALDLAVLLTEKLSSPNNNHRPFPSIEKQPSPFSEQPSFSMQPEAEDEEALLPCAQFARSPVSAAAAGSAFTFDKPWPQFRCSSLAGPITFRSTDSDLTLMRYSTSDGERWSGGPIFSRSGAIFGMVTTHVDTDTVTRLFQHGVLFPTALAPIALTADTDSGYGVASNSIVRYLEKSGIRCGVRNNELEEEEAGVWPYSGRRGELLLVVLCCRLRLLRVTREMANCESQDCMCLSHYMIVLMNDLFQMDDITTFLGFNSIRCVPDEGEEGGGRVEAQVLFTASSVCPLADALANIRDKLMSCNIAVPSDDQYHDACNKSAVEPSSLQLVVFDDWLRQWKGEMGKHCVRLVSLLDMQAAGGCEMLEKLAEKHVITLRECRQMEHMRVTETRDWELRRAFVELLRYKMPLDIDLVAEVMTQYSRTDFAHLIGQLKAAVMGHHKPAHC